MKRRGTGVLMAAALGAALAIGGCGSDESEPEQNEQQQDNGDKPKQKANNPGDDPEGDSGSDEPQPVPSLEGGSDSEERQQEGEDFLRSYIDELNRATQTGDFSKLKTMYTDECERCQQTSESEKVYEEGNSIKGGEWTPKDIDYQGTIEGVMMFEMTIHIAESEDIGPDGESVETYPEGTSKHLYTLSDEGGEWQVVGGESLE